MKTFDASYEDFFMDSQNVRLALSTDGFNLLDMGRTTVYDHLHLLYIIFPVDVHEATIVHHAIVDSRSYISK